MRNALIATAAAALSLGALHASASTISYNIFVNGVSIGSGSNTTGVISTTATGGGFQIILDGVGAPAQSAPNLSTNDFNIATGGNAGSVMIEVTNTGLSAPKTTVMNTFTTNSLDGSGFENDTISNYFDASDAAYGTGSKMATTSYSGLGSYSTGPTSYTISPTGLFSETTIYDLNFATGNKYSTVSASAQIVAATPEPNSLVLLGTGLVGAAGMLFMRRRESANLL